MRNHFAEADKTLQIIKAVDGMCAAISSPHRPSPKGDLRASLKAATETQVGQSEILAEIKQVRARIKAKFAGAEQSLENAEREISDLRSLKANIVAIIRPCGVSSSKVMPFIATTETFQPANLFIVSRRSWVDRLHLKSSVTRIASTRTDPVAP